MSPRAALALVCALGLALAAVAAYVLVVLDRPTSDLRWVVTSVTPSGPDRIRVGFVVEKPADREARCQVSAFTSDGTSAGRLIDVIVAPRSDGNRVNEVSVYVPTPDGEATDASVAQCALVRAPKADRRLLASVP